MHCIACFSFSSLLNAGFVNPCLWKCFSNIFIFCLVHCCCFTESESLDVVVQELVEVDGWRIFLFFFSFLLLLNSYTSSECHDDKKTQNSMHNLC